ncbi:magnesium chelatase domain-containing protein, partial [Mycobacterium avium]|uniref:magnesium chelatase domain-containing protein n=1 Tax=Mycobacterium avium TaxID=1764 RepID=UPI0026DCBDEA
MALGRAFSVAVRGVDGQIVEIEADITSGLPGVHLVGLPDAALQESRDRVRAAVSNCTNNWPQARLTLALSPPRPSAAPGRVAAMTTETTMTRIQLGAMGEALAVD